MTANYKSSPSRLARLFKQGREKWKKKALDRQKKLESVQALDINKWADDLLGKSALSKRRTLSYALENDTKNTWKTRVKKG